MYSGQRHTDNGEAMAHNRRVEQAREAEHLRQVNDKYDRQLIRLSGWEW